MEGRLTLSDSLPEPMLTVKMKHRVGAISLNLNFVLTKPWTVLFGPFGQRQDDGAADDCRICAPGFGAYRLRSGAATVSEHR